MPIDGVGLLASQHTSVPISVQGREVYENKTTQNKCRLDIRFILLNIFFLYVFLSFLFSDAGGLTWSTTDAGMR
jgi:hypothetical protein